MATQLEEDFDLDQQDQDLEPDDADQDNEAEAQDGDDQQPEDEEDQIIFGEDETVEGEAEPEGVRNLREHARKLERELKELKGQKQVDEVGPRPTMESCDEDEDRFAEELEAWNERRRAAEEGQRQQQAVAQRQQEVWEQQSSAYEQAFTGLKFAGKDAARSKVEGALPAEAIPMLVKAAKQNAAPFIAYLGSTPAKLDQLKGHIENGDWAEFIADVAVMAKEVRVERRKPTTTPEQRHEGRSGGGSGNADAKLERLEKEARTSGDRSKIVAYKAELKKLR